MPDELQRFVPSCVFCATFLMLGVDIVRAEQRTGSLKLFFFYANRRAPPSKIYAATRKAGALSEICSLIATPNDAYGNRSTSCRYSAQSSHSPSPFLSQKPTP